MPPFLPGLWVAVLALLLALALGRWYDPVPPRCWLAWGAAIVLLLGGALFAGRTLLPVGLLAEIPPFSGVVPEAPHGNYLQSDLLLQTAPWLAQVREAYAAGAWPLWNPLSGAGEPLLANPQSQALQPLAALALPFPIAAGFGVTAALRMLAAFAFTWLLLRRQGISEAVALAGSLAFGLGGFLQLWLGWPIAGSAAFLPALLYGIVLVDQRGARRDGALLALATACLLLVGHPETGLHIALFAAVFALSRLLNRREGRWRLASAWALAAILGAGLAAPLALPAAEALPRSQRAALLADRHERLSAEGTTASGDHDPRLTLIPVIAPNALGNDRYGDYWGERNTTEDASGFAGTVALLAALAAAWPPAAGRRFPQERLMLGTALLCLVIVARPAWLVALFEAVPVLRHSLTFHSRVALLLGFAIVYLAACTWERWRLGEVRFRRLALPAAAIAAAIVWSYLGHAGPEAADFGALRWGSLALQLAALAAAVVLLMWPATPGPEGPGYIDSEKPAEAGSNAGRRDGSLLQEAFWSNRSPGIHARASLAPRLRPTLLTLLIAAELIAFHAPAHPAAPAGLYAPVTPPVAFLQNHLNPWHRMAGLGPLLRPNLGAVYGLADLRSANASKPAAFQEVIRRINRFPSRATEGLIAPEDPLYAALGVRFVITRPRTRVGPPYELVFHRATAWIYENPDALPLLHLAAGSGTDALDLGTVEPEWLRARARLTGERLLASSLYQDGNWKLLVRGARRPAPANGPFLAARLPAGEARVDLLYRPGSFLAGLAVAALALAAGVAVWGAPQTARRSQARTQRSA
ncbi:MAG TPA: YfhO family protein [Thermoanaerobaculia bacterium]